MHVLRRVLDTIENEPSFLSEIAKQAELVKVHLSLLVGIPDYRPARVVLVVGPKECPNRASCFEVPGRPLVG